MCPKRWCELLDHLNHVDHPLPRAPVRAGISWGLSSRAPQLDPSSDHAYMWHTPMHTLVLGMQMCMCLCTRPRCKRARL